VTSGSCLATRHLSLVTPFLFLLLWVLSSLLDSLLFFPVP
jgi:hypothetical protein